MDFRDTPEEATFRTEVRSFIEQECPPEIRRRGFRAAFGGGGWDDIHMSREEYFKRNGAWVKKMSDRGLDRAGVAEGVRRRGAERDAAVHLQPGDGAVGRAARRQLRHRHRLGGPDDHHARHGGAEEEVPAGHRAGRRGVVPGLQRARRGQRPGGGADARGEGRRRLRRQRAEDLDVGRARRAVHDPAGAHGSGGAEAPGHQLLHPRHEVAGHRGAAAGEHGGQPRLQRGVLRQRARAEREHDRRGEPRLVRRARRRSTSSAAASRRASRTR